MYLKPDDLYDILVEGEGYGGYVFKMVQKKKDQKYAVCTFEEGYETPVHSMHPNGTTWWTDSIYWFPTTGSLLEVVGRHVGDGHDICANLRDMHRKAREMFL